MSEMWDRREFVRQLNHVKERAGALRQSMARQGAHGEKALQYLDRIEEGSEDLLRFARESLPEAETLSAEEASNLRHDFRNCLNRVYGPCQLLQRIANGDDSASDINLLREEMEVVLEMIDEIGEAPSSSLPFLATDGKCVVTARDQVESARILVAEDEKETRAFLEEVISEEGHSVQVASDGAEVLELLEHGDFDLVLLDLGLPKVDGFEILERIKAEGLLQNLSIIVVTGRRGVRDAVRCIEIGAEDFLSKPVEIELLRARINSSLEKKRLREREFTQFFPRELAREFARQPDLRNMAGKDAEVSVLFCDIRGFSRISERLGPDKTIRWLRAVMDAFSNCVLNHDGVLVDYTGDELMAMWGAPMEAADHATRACNAALDILDCLPALNNAWEKEIGTSTEVGIGINSGRALVGNIGTDRKFKYGPLGNPVNVASRVQGATQMLYATVLMTGQTRSYLSDEWDRGAARRLCKVRVKNIKEPVELYELVPREVDQKDLRMRYETALGHFEKGQYQQASAILGDLLVCYPKDGPSLLLMSRVVEAMLQADQEPNPIWELRGK